MIAKQDQVGQEVGVGRTQRQETKKHRNTETNSELQGVLYCIHYVLGVVILV